MNELTYDQKFAWFKARIDEKLSVQQIESKEELLDAVRSVNKAFRLIFNRGVTGGFIKKFVSELGIQTSISDETKRKRDWMYEQMDMNQALRENKTQLKKAVATHFGEKMLTVLFNQLWDDYHAGDNKPKPSMNIDVYGQKSLFDE